MTERFFKEPEMFKSNAFSDAHQRLRVQKGSLVKQNVIIFTRVRRLHEEDCRSSSQSSSSQQLRDVYELVRTDEQ